MDCIARWRLMNSRELSVWKTYWRIGVGGLVGEWSENKKGWAKSKLKLKSKSNEKGWEMGDGDEIEMG